MATSQARRTSVEPAVVVRNVDGRRLVSRSNPEKSYAYGAPSDARDKARRSQAMEASTSGSSNEQPQQEQEQQQDAGAEADDFSDAKARYAALRKKKQQPRDTSAAPPSPSKGKGKGRVSAAAQRSPLLGRNGHALDSIEEDRRSAALSDDLSSGAGRPRRAGIASPERSRGLLRGQLSSFYMDRSIEPDQGEAGREGENGLPSSILVGAQRPSLDMFANMGSQEMVSIQSSDAGDSRTHDYAEEARQASLLAKAEAAKSNSMLSSLRSPTSWFKGNGTQGNGIQANGTSHQANGNASVSPATRRKNKGRTSQENQAYRPGAVEDEDDSMSDLSAEDRKHSRRGRRSDGKSTARGGRDDNKIWMNARKRKGKRKGAGEDGNEEEEDDEEMLEEDEAAEVGEAVTVKQVRPRIQRHQKHSNSSSFVPSWTKIFATCAAAFALLYIFLLPAGVKFDLSGLPSDFTPNAASKSLSDLSSRIVSLESAYAALQHAKKTALKSEEHLSSRITAVESGLKSAAESMRSTRSSVEDRLKQAEAESVRVRAALEETRERLRSQSRSSVTQQDDTKTLQKRMETLEKQLERTDKRVALVGQQAATAHALAEQIKDGLSSLQKNLPAEVAVSTEPKSGKPILDASTLKELRAVFVEKGQDSTNWETFRKRNDAALRALASDVIAEESRNGAVISRALFLELLKNELDELKASMEERFNGNAQEMQNEILSKVRAQQEMFEKSGSWKKTGQANSQPGFEAGKDGNSARSAMLSLIDEALEIYSADRIARRDFALYSAGGRVIPSWTSPKLQLKPSSPSVFEWFTGKTPSKERGGAEGQPPVIALVPDNSPGMCWAFKGHEGQLGVALARRVVVSDITLEHISPSIAHGDGSSAPRDLTIWGIVERPADLKRLQEYRRQQATSGQQNDDDGTKLAPMPPSDKHLLLSSFTYDLGGPRSIQTFPASDEARHLQIPVAAIQARVHSNYGNREFTCLYRLRVHGQEWSIDDELGNAL